MLDITPVSNLVGTYVGKPKIRVGMEAALAPVERKKISKGGDVSLLELYSDGTFMHRMTTSGVYQVVGRRILLKPKEFNGASLDSMRSAAEQAGRSFGLAWLFDPFELVISGDTLETANSSSVIYTEYLRKS